MFIECCFAWITCPHGNNSAKDSARTFCICYNNDYCNIFIISLQKAKF